MLFNTLNYAIFFIVVFILYWFVFKKSFNKQNVLLLGTSYFFYACWDWRFLFMLIFSTILDYYSGIKIAESGNNKIKQIWLGLSISINLGILCVFKYFNFFVTSFVDLSEIVGFKVNPITFNILLPVGISFYTFHGISYLIDIYRDKIKVEKNVIDYSLFVSYFPLLVAGPIERATHLLPQLKVSRTFNYSKATDGLRQVLWGLVKKIVIADTCAVYANLIFNNAEQQTGSMLFLGALFFTFQIYGDFSGYSDIALGCSRILGIELLQNFSFPYFSRNIAEFWRRWHISLSSWFREYLYFPLGGSKGGLWLKIRNTFIIFLVSGFWHGANWTFICWGLLNAFYFLPSLLFDQNRQYLDIVAKGKVFPTFKELYLMGSTFMLTVFAWIFFRAESMTKAFEYIEGIFSKSFFTKPSGKVFFSVENHPAIILLIVIVFYIIEWIGRESKYALEKMNLMNKYVRWSLYYVLAFAVYWYSDSSESQQFIYFQF